MFVMAYDERKCTGVRGLIESSESNAVGGVRNIRGISVKMLFDINLLAQLICLCLPLGSFSIYKKKIIIKKITGREMFGDDLEG